MAVPPGHPDYPSYRHSSRPCKRCFCRFRLFIIFPAGFAVLGKLESLLVAGRVRRCYWKSWYVVESGEIVRPRFMGGRSDFMAFWWSLSTAPLLAPTPLYCPCYHWNPAKTLNSLGVPTALVEGQKWLNYPIAWVDILFSDSKLT
jgi:hypothetical protein